MKIEIRKTPRNDEDVLFNVLEQIFMLYYEPRDFWNEEPVAWEFLELTREEVKNGLL